MHRMLWLGVGLVASGCGQARSRPPAPLSNATPSNAAVSNVEYFAAGSRLLPTVASAEGAADYLLGWYDQELQTPCTFQRSTDGVLRCLPQASGGVRFADSLCREALGAQPFTSCVGAPPPAEPRFFWNGFGCNLDVYRVSTSATPPGTERPGYFNNLNKACNLDVESTIGPQSLPLELVPPAEFVAAQLGPGDSERSPGMKPWLLTADDGAWEIRGFFDVARGGPCALWDGSAEPSDKCLPFPRRGLDRSDASCGAEGASADSCETAPAVLYNLVEDRTRECRAAHLRLYEAQGPESRRACNASPQDTAPEGYFYLPGPELALEELPTLERLHAGAGRLRLQFQGHAGVPYFPDPTGSFGFLEPFPATFLDSLFAEPCWPKPLGAERFVCISEAWEEVEPGIAIYDYAACLSEPLAARRKPQAAARTCGAPPPALRGFWSRAEGGGGACPGSRAGEYELRSSRAFTGDVIYSPRSPFIEDRDCDEEVPDAELDYFLPGEPLAPDLVAEIVVHTPGLEP